MPTPGGTVSPHLRNTIPTSSASHLRRAEHVALRTQNLRCRHARTAQIRLPVRPTAGAPERKSDMSEMALPVKFHCPALASRSRRHVGLARAVTTASRSASVVSCSLLPSSAIASGRAGSGRPCCAGFIVVPLGDTQVVRSSGTRKRRARDRQIRTGAIKSGTDPQADPDRRRGYIP